MHITHICYEEGRVGHDEVEWKKNTDSSSVNLQYWLLMNVWLQLRG